MFTNRELPDSFLQLLRDLEESYLESDDPVRQSGFGGGPERWRSERGPILDAITGGGDLLDIGCANGYLLECLMEWGRERGLTIAPHGIDFGPRLIELAKQRLPKYTSNFYVGSAWDWAPSRQFNYVYTLHDCVPQDFLEEYLHRLLTRVVVPGGRLIVGAYGSRSRDEPPFDIKSFLTSHGFSIAGTAEGGSPPITSFAWIDK